MLLILLAFFSEHKGEAKIYLDFGPQRAAAAFFAIIFRFRGESAAARAAPPFAPPSFPSATAAGFFVGFSSGDPSHFSPIVCSTVRRAVRVKSWSLLERVGMIPL
jgi:hypothetical protein